VSETVGVYLIADNTHLFDSDRRLLVHALEIQIRAAALRRWR